MQTPYNNHESGILFRKKYSRCYGYKLNIINKDYYKILQHRKPSKLNETNSRDQIQLLYNFNELNDTHKKFILNKTIGLTGKKYNKNQKCNIFADFNECQHYQI